MQDNQQSAISIINEKIESTHKPVYQKPKTSLFLDPKTIASGSQGILESDSGNSGVMS